jgi:2-C-methyl-D-erythritol 4-phosphate cytidylyltransferase
MNICVIIPAAGLSTRFGLSDKLAADLGGRPLLVRTVELFAKRDEVKSIIVAGPPEGFAQFREKFGPTLSFHGATVVEGGRIDRWETVRNALAAVPAEATHVAVHDAARPCVSREVLNRVFEAAKSLPAVIVAVPINSTVKRVVEDAIDVTAPEEDAIAETLLGDAGKVSVRARKVIQTLDRTGLVEVQTPQVFEAALFRRAYAQADLSGVTDDASVIERLGQAVHVVDGDPRNIKITTPADLSLARAILGVPPPAQRPVHKQF